MSPAASILYRWTMEAADRKMPPEFTKMLWRAWDIVTDVVWTKSERQAVLETLRGLKIKPERADDLAQIIKEIEAAIPPKE